MTDMQHGSKLERTLHEVALYPPHPPRAATARYTQTHRKLINELDRPCLVCGVRKSTLNDPEQNPWGATQLETHHRVIEDSLALAIDVAKFNAHVRPGLLRKTGNQEKYGHDFTQEEMVEWIHGDEDQMWVLCDVHHRHPLVGIHAITYPVWSVQHLLIDDYDLTSFHPATPHEGQQLAALPTTTGQPAAI